MLFMERRDNWLLTAPIFWEDAETMPAIEALVRREMYEQSGGLIREATDMVRVHYLYPIPGGAVLFWAEGLGTTAPFFVAHLLSAEELGDRMEQFDFAH